MRASGCIGNRRLRLLLASSSVAALLVGGGAPSAFAANCAPSGGIAPTTSQASVSNSSPHSCIYINGISVTGSVTNTSTLTASGAAAPSRTGITINNATIGGTISNAGTITAQGGGILLLNATASGGIVNTGTISGSTGIFLNSYGDNGSFAGGISNGGTISAMFSGIGLSSQSTFSGGIANTGTISAAVGIVVNDSVTAFSGNISNGGTILAHGSNGIDFGATSFNGIITNNGAILGGTFAGIFLHEFASFGVNSPAGGVVNSGSISAGQFGIVVGGTGNFLRVGTFLGGVTNSGQITAANGILAGWKLAGTTGYAFTLTSFSGGIVNSAGGTITASGGNGIWVGARAITNTSVTVENFSGGIVNAGMITASAGKGIFVGGTATAAGSSVAISTFSGGISNGGTISAKTGIVVNNVLTFQGVITNSGTITGTGGVAIDLSAAPNSMTVDITGGAISGNIVGNGTGNGDIVNFSPDGTFAYSSTISGVQTVNVNSGTLFDGGAITAAGVVVNAGGTLAPGAPGSPSTLHITGSLVFASAAFYLDSISSTTASKTAVTGTATLGGASVQIASGSTVTGGKYTILTDTGGGLGGTNTFAGTVSYNGHTGTLSYDADDVYLTFPFTTLAPLLPAGAPANDVNVANAIDNFLAGGGTPPSGFSNLFNLTGAQLQTALTKLDGEDGTGAQTGAFTLMTELLNLMFGDNSGGGGGGLSFAPDTATNLPPDLALAYDAILKAEPKQTFDQHWSSWTSGFGGSSITDGNAAVGSNTFTATTYGSAAGMEYRPDPNTKLGFALAGAGLTWGLAQGFGTGRADAFQAGVYAKSNFGAAYLSGGFAVGNEWFTTNRTAAFADQLTATFQGQSYALRGEGGYRYTVPLNGAVIGVTPYGALQTQWFRTPAYSETDLSGGGFALSYNANTANDTRSELGARFDDLTTWNNKPLMLRASLAWAHDWVSGTGLNAAFQMLPGSGFTVNGAAVPPNSALTSASAQYFFTPALSFTAKFDGEFAATSQTYAGSGTVRYTW